MSLVRMQDVLGKAQKERYAVGAFNAENMEMVQAIVDAAQELNSPVIIQTTPSTIAYADVDMFYGITAAAAKKVSVPVVLHLDHGNSFDLCEAAVRAGYTSVMIDGSKLSFEENVLLSQKVADVGRAFGVDVEAELGTVGGKEDSHVVSDKDALYTNPLQAKEFVERTKIQSLAVAIGTAHGFYKGEPKLDFERLQEIRKMVDIPLVLHGASGVPDKAVREAIVYGISKVNVATELRVAYTEGVKSVLKQDEAVYDPKKYQAAGRQKVKEAVKEKILLCGSANKA